MREIKLSQGKVALLDDDDYEYLSQWKWYASKGTDTFYAKRTINAKGRVLRMHRVLMNAKKGVIIDHRDRNGLNNQRYNLRKCSSSQNCCNRHPRNNVSSIYKGVSYCNTRNMWVARINKTHKSRHLGYFDTQLEAVIIYNIAARKYHGEFANPNTFKHCHKLSL